MSHHVNESRSHHQSAGVDYLLGLALGDISDAHNQTIVDEQGIGGPDFAGDAEKAAGAILTAHPETKAIWAVWDVPAEGVAPPQQPGSLRFRGHMPPGTRGSMTIKIPLGPLPDAKALAWLEDLEFDEQLQYLKRRVRARPRGSTSQRPTSTRRPPVSSQVLMPTATRP